MSILELQSKVKELKTLPATFYRICELLDDPHCSAMKMGKEIASDPVIATKILRIANSSFYGFPSRIDSIPRAVAVIGFTGIRELVLATSVIDIFVRQVDGSDLNRQDFWKHSLGCAVAAKTIGKYLRNMEVEELFTAGLLHDLGKLIIDQYLTESFITIMNLARERKTISISEAEREVLGYSHTQVGAMVGQKWRLPPIIMESISCHHSITSTLKFPRQTSVIHIANSIAKAIGIGYSGYVKVPLIYEKAWDLAEMKINMLELVVEETIKEYGELEKVFT